MHHHQQQPAAPRFNLVLFEQQSGHAVFQLGLHAVRTERTRRPNEHYARIDIALSMAESFFDLLQRRAAAINSLLCVGLDPHKSDLGADATAEGAYLFCKRLVDACTPFAAAFKPNVAFFEEFGAAGADALVRLMKAIPADVPVVLDAKRGDISTTAAAYAAAAYGVYGAGSVTVNGYMGGDSIAPFLTDPTKGVWVLCKTSNPSSNELQTLHVQPATPGGASERVFEVVAKLSHTRWGSDKSVGLVVGATDVDALAAVRRVAPGSWILAPGVGFQGGDLDAALRAGLRSDGFGVLLPVSRGISRAANPGEAAAAIRDEINAARKAATAAATLVASPPQPPFYGSGEELLRHRREFISAALVCGVLRFGSFTLKSGRLSPYFFNAGNFKSGSALAALGRTYAAAISAALSSGAIVADVLFGPAYKGIPLVTAASIALACPADSASTPALDLPVAYNRKEAKDHGEGGTLVGADVAGKRVLIVDDVISAGTAVGESITFIKAAGGIPAGVVIGLDRQERGSGASSLSAVQQVIADYGIPVIAVAGLSDLVAFLSAEVKAGRVSAIPGVDGSVSLEDLLTRVREYRAVYGVDVGV